MKARVLWLLLLAGCASPDRFAQPDATWQTRIGQAKFVSGTRTLVGEVTVTTRGKNFVLDFRKGPGLPLLTIRSDGATTRYDGMLSHGSRDLWERVHAALAMGRAARVRIAGDDAAMDFQFAN